MRETNEQARIRHAKTRAEVISIAKADAKTIECSYSKCDETFLQYPFNKLYCTNECMKKAKSERSHTRVGSEKKVCGCDGCDNEFESKNPIHKYCSGVCKKKAGRVVRKEYQRKYFKEYSIRKRIEKIHGLADEVCANRNCNNKFLPIEGRLYCCSECRILEKRAVLTDKQEQTKVTKNCIYCDTEFKTNIKKKVKCGNCKPIKKIITKVCKSDECDTEFIAKPNQAYCESCKIERAKPKPKPKKKREYVAISKPKKKRAKKKYTPISKPKKPKKVVMALSKEVIDCINPEKKKDEVIVNRGYTDKEAEMILAFMMSKKSS